MQALLLPTYHRQIILVDKSNDASQMNQSQVLTVHKHHHPIVVLAERKNQVDMNVVCKGGVAPLRADVFSISRGTWASGQLINSMDLERQGSV